MPKIKKICKNCQDEYHAWPSVKKYFCSKRCMYSYSIGKPKHTDEHKQALSKRMQGNKYCVGMQGWAKGKKFSLEHRTKLSIARKGIRQSEEWKRHISETHKKVGVGLWMREKWTPERMKAMSIKGIYKQQTTKEPTSIEKKLYEELKRRGLLFETQKLLHGKFLVDAYIPSLNLVIEADGDYWHSLPKMKKRDAGANSYLPKHGYKLLRIKESQFKSGEYTSLLDETLWQLKN